MNRFKTTRNKGTPPHSSGLPTRFTWAATTRSDKGKPEKVSHLPFGEKTPFSRRDHTMTIDSKGKKIFLFGGKLIVFCNGVLSLKAGTHYNGQMMNQSFLNYGL